MSIAEDGGGAKTVSQIPHALAPIALTMGDPAGIGPEIALKTWLKRSEAGLPAFCYLGDAASLRAAAKRLSLEVAIETVNAIPEAAKLFRAALPVIDIPLSSAPEPGAPSAAAAGAIIAAIEEAARLALSGSAGAIVTNPIAKHVLQQAGFPHPGHTEFLGAIARRAGYEAAPVMLLVAPQLRIAPVTIHVPLREVASKLTPAAIIAAAATVAEGLERLFGIKEPRLAITGLNPHAGEGGTMGDEERTVIAPAIAALAARGLRVSGPHPADALFHSRARLEYDAVIAMYHDQALIPVKTLAFDEGVNVTLGLPFIRTSPDHGTAFDIAGRGLARPDSLMHALRLARSMAAALSKMRP